jgi:hypothetical protein
MIVCVRMLQGPKEASGSLSSGNVLCFEGDLAAAAAKSAQPLDLKVVAARLDAGELAVSPLQNVLVICSTHITFLVYHSVACSVFCACGEAKSRRHQGCSLHRYCPVVHSWSSRSTLLSARMSFIGPSFLVRYYAPTGDLHS